MGFLFNGGMKAAKLQAKATADSAALTANSDRVVAQGAQQAMETQLAQKIATDKAAEVLGKPQGQIDVQLAPEAAVAEIDQATGRLKTTRSTFTGKRAAGSGIRI